MHDPQRRPLGSLLSLVSDRTGVRKDQSKAYVGLEHIPSSGSLLKAVGTAADSSSTNNVFASGDVLFGKLRPRLRKSVRVSVAGYCSTDVLVLRPVQSVDPVFAGFVAQSDAVFSVAIRTEEGTKMPRCSWRDLRTIEVFCPVDRRSQSAIARALLAVDTAIEHTEALIEKHEQIKAGLMHDLFTRGVLPNGELRPRCEAAPEIYRETAIGRIPAEWRVIRLGELAKIVSGVTLGVKNSPRNTISVPYLRVANVQDGYLDLSEIKTVQVWPRQLEQLRLQPGDVLMNEGGDFDKLGRGAVWAGELENCVHQNHVFRVRTNAAALSPQFLALYSESSFGKRYFLLSSKRSTNLASINSTQLNAYPIAVPGLPEQEAIVQRLGGANRWIGSLRAEVSKLRQQKLGLMQDLLTGKVPVNVDEATTTA